MIIYILTTNGLQMVRDRASITIDIKYELQCDLTHFNLYVYIWPGSILKIRIIHILCKCCQIGQTFLFQSNRQFVVYFLSDISHLTLPILKVFFYWIILFVASQTLSAPFRFTIYFSDMCYDDVTVIYWMKSII